MRLVIGQGIQYDGETDEAFCERIRKERQAAKDREAEEARLRQWKETPIWEQET